MSKTETAGNSTVAAGGASTAVSVTAIAGSLVCGADAGATADSVVAPPHAARSMPSAHAEAAPQIGREAMAKM